MSRINVFVIGASRDVKAAAIAKAIANSVADRSDMNLVEGSSENESGCVPVDEVDGILRSIDPSVRCALVLVGPPADTNELAKDWLTLRDDLAVMHVDVADYVVRIGLVDSNLHSLLTALRELVESAGTQKRERVTRIQLRPVKSPFESGAPPHQISTEHSLLEASIKWVHGLLRNAVETSSDDVNGLTVTRKGILESLEAPPKLRESEQRVIPDALEALDKELDSALAKADTSTEPLAVAFREFGLEPVGFRMMILGLAPELDIRYQRCIGFLLDEIGRRVGTLSLYGSLLGITASERDKLIGSAGLERWLVFEGLAGHPSAADEPLRLDPVLAQWLLDDRAALASDPRVRRILRLEAWPGASLLTGHHERAKAAGIINKLLNAYDRQWILLDGSDPAGWRALLELGTPAAEVELIRCEPVRLMGIDFSGVEDSARRLARMTRLSGQPLIIDVAKAEGTEAEDDLLQVFFATLDSRNCQAAVISREEARIIRILGKASYELESEPALSKAARVEAVRAAALGAEAYLTQESAESIANRYPLHVDGLEQAMRLAVIRPKNFDADNPDLERLTTAFKELASEGVSHLVERIEPVFSLEEVVLPPDRKQQLNEIVDQIRLAPRVLDDWKFRDQLPYGRGVAALFFGASGTGKSMAAMGIARQLDIQILRLDLSRVVSKYIGETEKNIDRVFTDAQASGAAVLIDEADALLGKRSEVKDAHDRYANIEVAYLLQRIEAYEGLAILTTNLRKNLDAAFLRRLRFIIEFPRPDAEAREKIWRQCLPHESHELNDADFRQLARRIDVTGGQIRQITLRAAFIAAAAGKQIGLEHVVQAASAELAKLGMPPIEIDLTQIRRAAA
ncbi:MAG TPA: ATP-binding protein [Pyrinomonadaceae bacterium]